MKYEELIYCSKCRSHLSLYFIDDKAVSEKPCKCAKRELLRPDWMEVIKPIIEDFKQRSENVTRDSKSISQISPAIKANK